MRLLCNILAIAPLFAGVSLASEPTLLWSDLDHDGWDDFLALNPSGQLRLFANLGNGSFQEATPMLGLGEEQRVLAIKEADFDGNGLPDLFLLLEGGQSVSLLQGRGFAFEKLTALISTGEALPLAASIAWRDFDRDGREDLLLQTLEGEPRAFRNLGTGRFEPASLMSLAVPPSGPLGSITSHGPIVTGIVPNFPTCKPSIKDQATGNCLEASSIPTIGMLYPMSDKLSVEAGGLVKLGVGLKFPNGTVQSTAQLVGPQGPTGPQGPQGPAGPQGTPGNIQSINGSISPNLTFSGLGGTSIIPAGSTIFVDSSGVQAIKNINGKTAPAITLQGQGGVTVGSGGDSVITISAPATNGITTINNQDGPGILIQGSGGVSVQALNDLITISAPPAITSINGSSGPSINIQGSGGATVSTSGNTITISVPSAICTWTGKTYSTGATCYTQETGGNCFYPEVYKKKWTCSSSGSWSSSSASCSTAGPYCGQ